MTVEELKKYIETVLNIHSSGNSISPTEFNLLLEANIYNFVKDQVVKYRSYVNQGTPTDGAIYTSLLMDSLQVNASVTLSTGTFTVPSNSLYVESLYGTYNGHTKRIELVDPTEYQIRKSNFMSRPLTYFPICYIVGTTGTVIPKNMTDVYINYIKKPAIPIFDYYIDANDNIVYLAAAATHALTAGETGSAGQTSTTVTSLTVELTDIPEELHLLFADYLIKKIGIKDKNEFLYTATQNEINGE